MKTIKEFTPVGQGMMSLDIDGKYLKTEDVLGLIDEVVLKPKVGMAEAITRGVIYKELKARIEGESDFIGKEKK